MADGSAEHSQPTRLHRKYNLRSLGNVNFSEDFITYTLTPFLEYGTALSLASGTLDDIPARDLVFSSSESQKNDDNVSKTNPSKLFDEFGSFDLGRIPPAYFSRFRRPAPLYVKKLTGFFDVAKPVSQMLESCALAVGRYNRLKRFIPQLFVR